MKGFHRDQLTIQYTRTIDVTWNFNFYKEKNFFMHKSLFESYLTYIMIIQIMTDYLYFITR